MLVVCKKCKGSKKYSPLGMMEVKCSSCDGVGYVKSNIKLVDAKLDIEKQMEDMPEGIAEAVAFKEVKRRGRKPREAVING